MRDRIGRPKGLVGCCLVAVLFASACNRGFDARYHCNHTLGCVAETSRLKPAWSYIDECIEEIEELYGSCDEGRKDLVDAKFEACEDEVSCGYVECSRGLFGPAEGNPDNSPGGTSGRPTCWPTSPAPDGGS